MLRPVGRAFGKPSRPTSIILLCRGALSTKQKSFFRNFLENFSEVHPPTAGTRFFGDAKVSPSRNERAAGRSDASAPGRMTPPDRIARNLRQIFPDFERVFSAGLHSGRGLVPPGD